MCLHGVCTLFQTTDTVIERSEEEQLETAIRASLRECRLLKSSHSQQNGDSDEFISLSSGDEDLEGDVNVEQDGEPLQCRVKVEVEPDSYSKCKYSSMLCNQTRANKAELYSSVIREESRTPLNTRKRKGFNEDPPSRKFLRRSNFEDPCLAASRTSAGSNKDQSRTQKGKISSNWQKNKQRASASTKSVEERLVLGEIQKSDVTQIVIRLPDGTRIQTTFLRSSPIKVSG